MPHHISTELCPTTTAKRTLIFDKLPFIESRVEYTRRHGGNDTPMNDMMIVIMGFSINE